MTKTDLHVGLVCVDINTLEKRTIIEVATEGVGDSVAWRNADGTEAGGSATEFCQTHIAMPGHIGLTHEGNRGSLDSPHHEENRIRVAQREADITARDEQLAIEEQARLELEAHVKARNERLGPDALAAIHAQADADIAAAPEHINPTV